MSPAAPTAYEVNFDTIVGPTHNYAGLSYGNVASLKHAGARSSPRAAALQGLAKMALVARLGRKQAVLPPQERPDLVALRRLGFTGSDVQIIEKAAKEAPALLAACYSASSMWAANAATVSPSADTADGRLHLTPANLISTLHRSLEPIHTAATLRTIFANESVFAHHDPLPAAVTMGDEGAANHTRLCREYGGPGIELFVYGRQAMGGGDHAPQKFPARQTLEASQAIARLHGLDPSRVVFARQSPAAIDAGVFHNDVIAVGDRDTLFFHSQGFAERDAVLDELRKKFTATCGGELRLIEVTPDEVPLADAVSTYLFNSQLFADGDMLTLVGPSDCMENDRTRRWLDQHADLFSRREFIDLRESMRNGGGPACLRLRVVLTERELARVHPGVLWSEELHRKLTAWVERHYRDTMEPGDLADPKLIVECRDALDALNTILGLKPRPAGER